MHFNKGSLTAAASRAVLIGALMCAHAPAFAQPQSSASTSDSRVNFNIDAQPLPSALTEYVSRRFFVVQSISSTIKVCFGIS